MFNRHIDKTFSYGLILYIWACMLYADTDYQVDKILFRLGIVGAITYLILKRLLR